MADRPDFTMYSYVEILVQTLERIINRPSYGGAEVSTVEQDVAANADTTLITITGQGMIYGGRITVAANMIQPNSMWLTTIDDNIQSLVPFSVLAEYNMGQPHGVSPIITRYDPTNFRYGFILPYGVTFEESAIFAFRETHGDTPTILMDMTYALI